MKISVLFIVLLTFSGCAIKDVKPWEKGIHAKDTMKQSCGNSLYKKFVNHIYFSKEASKGGGGVAGGGCGCN